MVATEPGKSRKMSIFKKVSENLQSWGNLLKKHESGKTQGIIFGLLYIVNILAVKWTCHIALNA